VGHEVSLPTRCPSGLARDATRNRSLSLLGPQGPDEPEAARTERHASWAELFFDLVAVAGVSALAHLLGSDLNAAALGLYALPFLAFWLSWTTFMLYSNVAADQTRVVRLLIGMFGLGVMDRLHRHAHLRVPGVAPGRDTAGLPGGALHGRGCCPGSRRSGSASRGSSRSGRRGSASTCCWSWSCPVTRSSSRSRRASPRKQLLGAGPGLALAPTGRDRSFTECRSTRPSSLSGSGSS
jgi:Bacterial low temperature requirement A protein (LtrA)